jgi:hypothetical protein
MMSSRRLCGGCRAAAQNQHDNNKEKNPHPHLLR